MKYRPYSLVFFVQWTYKADTIGNRACIFIAYPDKLLKCSNSMAYISYLPCSLGYLKELIRLQAA